MQSLSKLYADLRPYIQRQIAESYNGNIGIAAAGNGGGGGTLTGDEWQTSGDALIDANQASTTTVVYVRNDAAGGTANLSVEGDILVGGTVDGVDVAAHAAATGSSVHGLGTMSTQSAASVAITGGTITGITDLAVADGGTGASTASGARTNLGLVIGTNVQAWDADLDAIAALDKTDGNIIVGNSTTWVAESGSTARESLGLVIGTDVQTWNINLDTISAIVHADGAFMVSDGANWTAESGSTARDSLGLGTIATQSAASVAITGGSITGITDLAVADGGTGASTAAAAATNLGLGTGNSPQFTAVNLGHATDTTIARVSAGLISVEGDTVALLTSTQTMTNKTLTSPVISNLTAAARLMSHTAGKVPATVSSLTSWVAGTTNRITVADDGDGTITLSGPQDIATTSSPQFAAVNFGADVQLSRAGADVLGLASGDSFRSSNFASGASGWKIDADGTAEFLNVFVRGELHAAVFVKDLIEAHAGSMVIGKSAGVLTDDMVVPASGTWSMKVNDPPGGGFLFANSDICRVKVEYAAGIGDIWFVVSARTDNADGTQSYTCTYSSGTRSITYPSGSPCLDYGTSGDGLLLMTADLADAPYYDVQTHAGAPWSATTVRARIGNLAGITDAELSPSGYGFYSDNAFLKGKLVVGNDSVTLDDAGLSLGGGSDSWNQIKWYDGAILLASMYAEPQTGYNDFRISISNDANNADAYIEAIVKDDLDAWVSIGKTEPSTNFLGLIVEGKVTTPAITTASGALTVTPAAGSGVSFALSTTGDFAVNTNDLYVDTSTGNVGIATTAPGAKLDVDGLMINGSTNPSISDGGTLRKKLEWLGVTNSWGVYNSNDSGSNWQPNLFIEAGGNVGFGTTGPGAKAHIDQSSTTGAVPVLLLDQADTSEEFIEFTGTVGTGNSIEAVGAKSLTTTHFLRMNITGVGYRYIPVGTIA